MFLLLLVAVTAKISHHYKMKYCEQLLVRSLSLSPYILLQSFDSDTWRCICLVAWCGVVIVVQDDKHNCQQQLPSYEVHVSLICCCNNCNANKSLSLFSFLDKWHLLPPLIPLHSGVVSKRILKLSDEKGVDLDATRSNNIFLINNVVCCSKSIEICPYVCIIFLWMGPKIAYFLFQELW